MENNLLDWKLEKYGNQFHLELKGIKDIIVDVVVGTNLIHPTVLGITSGLVPQHGSPYFARTTKSTKSMEPQGDYVITPAQLKFIRWVFENHKSDLVGMETTIVEQTLEESDIDRNRGYMNGSSYQENLNAIRDRYLKEYGETR